jgi:hypothetical protein
VLKKCSSSKAPTSAPNLGPQFGVGIQTHTPYPFSMGEGGLTSRPPSCCCSSFPPHELLPPHGLRPPARLPLSLFPYTAASFDVAIPSGCESKHAITAVARSAGALLSDRDSKHATVRFAGALLRRVARCPITLAYLVARAAALLPAAVATNAPLCRAGRCPATSSRMLWRTSARLSSLRLGLGC